VLALQHRGQMKKVFILVSLLFLLVNLDASAQLKPAQSQYLVEKGVLINPSFEQGYKGWVITGCTKSLVTETPYLNKSLKLTCVNETFSIKQESTSLSDFENQQGAFDLQIKTSADGVKVASLNNSIRNTEYTQIASTTFKRYKEIGFIVDSTSNGIEVYSDTNFTGEIIVDDFKLGLGNLTQEIGTAHFVGKATYASANCNAQQTGTGTTTWINFPSDVDCVSVNEGGVSGGTDFSITFNAIAGVNYEIKHDGFINAYNSSGQCRFSFSSISGTYDNQPITNINQANTTSDNTIRGSFKFNSDGVKTIRILTKKTTSGVRCGIYGSPDLAAAITVYAFPDSKSTIVSQDTELTAETSNTLSATFNQSGSGNPTLLKENYTWIDSCIRNSTGRYVCTTKMNLTETPSCYGNDLGGSTPSINVGYNTANNPDTFILNIQAISNTASDRPFSVSCEKVGEDTNKSQTIVGNFGKIRSDDLVLVEAEGNDAETITATTEDIPFKTTTRDVNSLWSNAGNTGNNTKDAFTAPKSADYDISLSVQAASGIPQFVLYVNGLEVGIRRYTPTASIIHQFEWLNIPLNQGDILTFRSNLSLTLTGTPTWHKIKIIQKATKESIVANLIETQVTKCQTKYLSANVTATGVMTDLSFSNLDTTKFYSVTAMSSIVYSTGNTCEVQVNDGASSIARYSTRGADAPADRSATSLTNPFFKPSTTNLTFIFVENNTCYIEGNGAVTGSWATLCELPETVIETTEFD